MKVYVLIVKSNPHADMGEVRKVFATRAKAEQHAKLLLAIGGCPEIVESNLVGEE